MKPRRQSESPWRRPSLRRSAEKSKLIEYRDSLDGLALKDLSGFFNGWPSPPSDERFWQTLNRSYAILLAYDQAEKELAGFITAISDGVFAAFIPLLEVKPKYQRTGIGRELVVRMEERLVDLYSIDVVCDPDVSSFYSKLGYISLSGHGKRFRKSLADAGWPAPPTEHGLDIRQE
jgi:ribosomal protein S18 acetylase RimI-like enzyme